MKRKPLLARNFIQRIINLSVLLGLIFFAGSCSSAPGGYSGPPETIVFGDLNVESSAFVYIAEEKGFFKNNNIDITIKTFDTGPDATAALMKNQVEMATSGEFPFVNRILAKDQLTIIATIDRFQAFYLIGRKDRGIQDVADLQGKTVGLVRGALPEFYLGRYLDLHGMNIRAVQVVNIKPAQWVDAISNGDVDAIVVSQAYISDIEAELKDNILIWPVQSNQDAFGLVFSRSDWVNQHPDLVRRFLLSLAQAEEYAVQNPAGARAIVQKRLELDDAYLDKAWSKHSFSLSLYQALVVAMEDEARWMIANKLTNETTIPNLPPYVYVDGLKAVKPEAVNIIR